MKTAARLADLADAAQPKLLARLEKQAKEQYASILPEMEKAAGEGLFNYEPPHFLYHDTVKLLRQEGFEVVDNGEERCLYQISWRHMKRDPKPAKRARKH